MTDELGIRPPRPTDAKALKLLEKARELESAFLAEMLGHANVGESPEGFGGGIGEQQFASFLRAEHARLMVEKGGIGLSQALFDALLVSESKDA